MGGNYMYTENDGDPGYCLHTGEDEEEEAYKVAQARLEAEELEKAAAAEKAMIRAQQAKKKICSCGYFTCGLVKRFGTPKPCYDNKIEPIGSQYERDKKALDLIATGQDKVYDDSE